MMDVLRHLAIGNWGLARARQIARSVEQSPASIRALIRTLFADDPETRKRAADVTRRITESSPVPLHVYADQLAGLLASTSPAEQRTRWHLGLVVPRVAHTREQRLRASRLMLTLTQDEGNVVRCSAVEGLATLAVREPSLRPDAEEVIESYLRSGTLAMKSRARHAARLLSSKRLEQSSPVTEGKRRKPIFGAGPRSSLSSPRRPQPEPLQQHARGIEDPRNQLK